VSYSRVPAPNSTQLLSSS